MAGEQKPFFDVEGARKAGYTDTEIADHLADINKYDAKGARDSGYSDGEIINHLSGAPKVSPANAPVIQSSTPKDPHAFVRSVVSAGIGALGGGAAIGSGFPEAAPWVTSGLTAASDYGIRKAQGLPEQMPLYGDVTEDQIKSPIVRGIADVGTNTLFNEGVGRAVDAGLGASKEALRSTVPDLLEKFSGKNAVSDFLRNFNLKGAANEGLEALKPTYAQLSGSRLAKFVENNFSRANKAAALDRSQSLAYDQANEMAQLFTGRKVPITTEDLGNAMQVQAKADYSNAVIAGDNLSNDVRRIAAQNTATHVTPSTTAQVAGNVIDPATGKPAMQTVTTPGQVTKIQGPIVMDQTVNKLLALKRNISTSLDKPDPNNPLIHSLDNILDSLGYKEENGVVTIDGKVQPFERAWQTKKDIGARAFDNADDMPDYVRKGYKEIYHALDNDISDSISNWKNGGSAASDAWNNVKELVNKTYENHFPDREQGAGVRQLLNDVNTPHPTLDAISEDPKKLQRFLNTGETKLTDGTIITASNKRRDMQGYKLMSLFQDAWKPATADEENKGITNASKLKESVNNYLNSDAGQKLYSPSQRDDIAEFINNVDKVSGTLPDGQGRRLGLQVAKGGTFILGGGLLSHILGGPGPSGYAALGEGAVLTGAVGVNYLAKILTNPEAAKVLNAAVSGQGLGMSERMASRIIGNALKGAAMTVNLPGGGTANGTIDKNGQFAIPYAGGDVNSIKVKQ